MTTRRWFLASLAGTSAVAGLAGCLGFLDDGDTGGTTTPEDGQETDDELLRGLADPADQVPPRFLAGYRFEIDELLDRTEPLEILPHVDGSVSARAIAQTFDSQIEGVSLEEIDELVGSTYRSTGVAAGLDIETPSGEGIQVTGEFAADPLVDFFEATDTYESIGSSSGYERFVRQREEFQEFRAFAIAEGSFIASRRTNVSVEPEDALALEIDQIDRSDAPIANTMPAFAQVAGALDDGPVRAAAGYALVPFGSDTGTTAFDEAIPGVVGSGLSATSGAETSLQRAVAYLDSDMASESAVEEAFDAGDGSIPADEFSYSTDDAVVSARATLDSQPEPGIFRTALPVPGYDDLFVPVAPSDLGRTAPPEVFFQPSIDDGTLRIEHIGGTELEDLRVRYVSDGEIQQETWEGPVGEGDQFTSAETIDGRTQAWVTWRPETVDAAVLTRFETPE